MNRYNTEQRKLLNNFFKEQIHVSFSAQEVYEKLKMNDISKSAVYRNLTEMEKEGIICRVSEKNRPEALFQYVHPEHCCSIVHLKCETCNNTFHMNRHVSNLIFNMANDDYAFMINPKTAMLYGECKTCFQKITNKMK